MKLNDDLVILPLASERGGQTNVFHASLILDAAHGPTLVDTGLPDQAEAIEALLAPQSLDVAALRRIVLTHQDIDHIGSLHELATRSGARVLAHRVEAPCIDGRELPRFARPEVLDERPFLRPFAEQFQPTAVDEQLEDGARLDLAGGVQIVFTPGHTSGHICLYLERSRALIAGDALTASDGRLQGPNPAATLDMALASASVQRLAELDVAAIVCYHGGLVDDDASGQLRRIAAELATGGEIA